MRRDRINYSAGVAAWVVALQLRCLLVSRTALAQTAAGSFQSVNGQVHIDRALGATVGAASGVGVNVGDRIITGPNGHAVIILNDQSRLELGPASSITLDQFTIIGGATEMRVNLSSGVVRSLMNAASGAAPKLRGAYSQRDRSSARDQVRHRVQRECNSARLPGMRKIY